MTFRFLYQIYGLMNIWSMLNPYIFVYSLTIPDNLRAYVDYRRLGINR
jgi:hypothetical protein